MISKKDVVFYVDEKSGVVVAKPKERKYLENKIWEIFDNKKYYALTSPFLHCLNVDPSYVNKYVDKIANNTLEGKAKCNMETDIFNIETGKEIAYLKLKSKISYYCVKIMSEWSRDIEKSIAAFEKDFDYYLSIYDKSTSKYEKYL